MARRLRQPRAPGLGVPSRVLYFGWERVDAEASEKGCAVSIEFKSIGHVRTESEEIPRHWSVSEVEGTLAVDEEYAEGLRDIRPGQRIVVIFLFDRSPRFSPEHLRQRSGESGEVMGVFSICSPVRPNPIGMSILEVLGVEGANVSVRRLDALDGTPILDI